MDRPVIGEVTSPACAGDFLICEMERIMELA
jgi:hypothetical protein